MRKRAAIYIRASAISRYAGVGNQRFTTRYDTPSNRRHEGGR
jgi:hypothetical protein